jgi:hypothetical protein
LKGGREMRKWRVLILALVLIPLAVGAETISWTPNPTYKDGSGSFTSAEMATMTYYLRGWKAGSAAKTYFGETRNGGTSWTDNILVKMNEWAVTSGTSGWVVLKPGDNVFVSVSMAFKDSAGVETDSAESLGYAYTIPGGVVVPVPVVSFAALPVSVNKGVCSTLSWSSTNATVASLDQGIGSVATTGTKSVCPAATTTYTLMAMGAGGTTIKTATVTVIIPPTPVPGCNPPTGITIKP